VPPRPKTLNSLVLPDADNVDVVVGGNVVRLTNLRKPFWPDLGITKGDLLHQRSKLERSGLIGCFRHVEVVSHKTTDVYTSILARHGVAPDRFVMVGNSLRSDVLPVVEAGGWAVYVPAAVSWSHEDAEAPVHLHGRFVEVPALERVPDAIRTLVRTSPSRRAAPAAGRRRPGAGSRRS